MPSSRHSRHGLLAARFIGGSLAAAAWMHADAPSCGGFDRRGVWQDTCAGAQFGGVYSELTRERISSPSPNLRSPSVLPKTVMYLIGRCLRQRCHTSTVLTAITATSSAISRPLTMTSGGMTDAWRWAPRMTSSQAERAQTATHRLRRRDTIVDTDKI